MNIQTAINFSMSTSDYNKGRFFEEEIAKKLSKKDLMEAYSELAIRCKEFSADLSIILNGKSYYWADDIDNNKVKDGYYPYVRFDASLFVEILTKILKNYNINSFLDVGAGYGDKVKIASKFIKKSNGIEYLKNYVDTAKSLGVSILWADAFNFNRYKNYDLIYMYHPIEDTELYKKLLSHIMKNMKIGGYILEVLPNSIFSKCSEKFGIEILEKYSYKFGIKNVSKA